jgi:hypothetical protein
MDEENKPKPAQINRTLIKGQTFISLEDLLMALQSEVNFVNEDTKTYINKLCERLETILL